MKIMLDEGAKMPTRSHTYDAGLDLYAKDNIEPVTISVGGSAAFDTGCHFQIPRHFAGLVKSRSGLMFKEDIVTDGLVDADYTGPVNVKLFNLCGEPYTVMPGEKIAQLVIVPCCLPPLEQVEKLEKTERGSKGFGSTGR